MATREAARRLTGSRMIKMRMPFWPLRCGATGHSARDTYAMLARHGVSMVPKAFAIGAFDRGHKLCYRNLLGGFTRRQEALAGFVVDDERRDRDRRPDRQGRAGRQQGESGEVSHGTILGRGSLPSTSGLCTIAEELSTMRCRRRYARCRRVCRQCRAFVGGAS